MAELRDAYSSPCAKDQPEEVDRIRETGIPSELAMPIGCSGSRSGIFYYLFRLRYVSVRATNPKTYLSRLRRPLFLPQPLLRREIFERRSLLQIPLARHFLQVSSDASAPHLVSFNFGIRTKEGPECLWGGTRGRGGLRRRLGEAFLELSDYFEDCAASRQSRCNSS